MSIRGMYGDPSPQHQIAALSFKVRALIEVIASLRLATTLPAGNGGEEAKQKAGENE